MSQIDVILKLVTAHGGDTIELIPGVVPSVHGEGKPVTLFLPAMPASVIRDFWRDLDQTGPGSTEHDAEDAGHFEVSLDGAGALRVRRLGDARPEHIPPPKPREPVPRRGAVSAAPEPAPERAPVAPPAPATAPATRPRRARPAALDTLLHRAHERGASDVHLATGEPVLVRVDGALVPLASADAGPAIDALLERVDGDEALAEGRSADAAFTLAGGPRVRASVYRHGDGYAAALRLLPGAAPTLESLNLPVDLSDITRIPHGLVLLCGPTGSGKSTTLAALVRATLEARGGALLTLEEPVEYTIQADRPGVLVRQREVGRDVPDFATGLRDALRADPDVLLIGEMRDPETITLALTAAETGHLVFASLHSRSARSAVERIVDAYPPERQRQVRVQLADALRVSIAQRLLPRRAGGRAVAMEVMRVNHNVAGLIRDGRTAQLTSAVQSGGDDGMVLLERSLATLARGGAVDPQVAQDAADDPKAFLEYLR